MIRVAASAPPTVQANFCHSGYIQDIADASASTCTRRMRKKSIAAGIVPKPRSDQETQSFLNVNATRQWGTVQNVAPANVPKAAEQVNLWNVARALPAPL